ncbi:hypothetical protein [Hahella sp. KA22]|uniref:hypothetical protein n=1 Tax=Hahella sp. KA22 TaxID=1628392 RepID=UPI0012ADEF05|nr:hypothetical protein [Hahella sp. KA22]
MMELLLFMAVAILADNTKRNDLSCLLREEGGLHLFDNYGVMKSSKKRKEKN